MAHPALAGRHAARGAGALTGARCCRRHAGVAQQTSRYRRESTRDELIGSRSGPGKSISMRSSRFRSQRPSVPRSRLRPRRRGTPKRSSQVVQTQIILVDHRRARDDRCRDEPGARIWRGRCRGSGAVPREDRRSQRCRRHADDAGRWPGVRHRRLWSGGVRHGIPDGRAVGHRVVRAERAQGVHPRDQGRRTPRSSSRRWKRCCAAGA